MIKEINKKLNVLNDRQLEAFRCDEKLFEEVILPMILKDLCLVDESDTPPLRPSIKEGFLGLSREKI